MEFRVKAAHPRTLPGWAAAACIFVVLLLAATIRAADTPDPGVSLTILHINDLHGHIVPFIDRSIDKDRIGGAGRLGAMIAEERAANPDGTILLSAGDMFQGTPISNLFHGRPVIEVMNYLRFDAMALGNHEFDWGQEVLRGIISSARFPVLSANVIERGSNSFDGARRYVLLREKGLSIGIIGLTTPEAEFTSKPGNFSGISVLDPSQIVPPLMNELRAQGAGPIVVLSHLGLQRDRRLARENPGIDIIVGGHSHTAIEDPVVERGTIIVQAGSNGAYLGVLKIVFDPARKKIRSYTRSGELKTVFSGPGSQTDPRAARIVEKYEAQVRAEFSKVVGTAAVDLTRNKNNSESNLGNLITDAMREASGAQVAFYNSGGIRADIPKGPITLEQVYIVMPFGDQVVAMDLSGQQLLKALEKTIASGGSLEVSGVELEYDMTKPAGWRVISASVGEKPIDPAAYYRVAVNDFLAAGGDRFEFFKDGKNVVLGPDARDVVVEYIRSHSPVGTRIQGRLRARE